MRNDSFYSIHGSAVIFDFAGYFAFLYVCTITIEINRVSNSRNRVANFKLITISYLVRYPFIRIIVINHIINVFICKHLFAIMHYF